MSERLGPIVQLQIHAESLKRDGAYVPEPLIAVERVSLDESGVLGWDGSGWIVDVHHAAHPRLRGGGRRAVSVGFTGHYRRMEERFGPVTLGIAAESIVVDGPPVSARTIADGLLIRKGDGTVIELRSPEPAVACTGFTSYLLGSPTVLGSEEIEDDLAFLSTGTRGFIVAVDHLDGPVEVEIGDGTKVRLHPGHILLAEDTTGQGHISRSVGSEDRISLFIPLAEQ